MPASPDPVAEAAAYRAMLLELCGDGDPAAILVSTPDELRRLVLEAEGRIRVRPAPGEWSVLELIGHITDAELVWGGRFRWVLAEDEPALPGYDQDRWVAALGHNDGDPERLIRLFEAMRAANVALWLATPAERRTRAAIHGERGRETLEQMYRMIAGHDRFHLNQSWKTLDAVRSSG